MSEGNAGSSIAWIELQEGETAEEGKERAIQTAKQQLEKFGVEKMQELIERMGWKHGTMPTGQEELPGRLTPYDTAEIIQARAEQAAQPSTHTIQTPERQALREQIVEKLSDTTDVAQDAQAYIILGPPGAGKSRALGDRLVSENKALLVDADVAKEELPEYEGGKYAGAVHVESSDIVDRVFQRVMDSGHTMVLPYVGKNTEKIRTIVDILAQKGYDVHLALVDLPADKAAQRAVERYIRDGRFVDPARVLEVGDSPRVTYGIIRDEGKVTSYEWYSNDVLRGQEPILIESSINPERATGSGRSAAGRNDSGRETIAREGPAAEEAAEEVTPETAEETRETTPKATPQVTPEATPETTPEATPQVTPEAETRAEPAPAETAPAEAEPAAEAEEKPARKLSDELIAEIDKVEQAAKDRLRDILGGGTIGANLPIAAMTELATIGGCKIAKGFVTKAAWAQEMVREFGDGIRQHLDDLWQHARGYHDNFLSPLIDKYGERGTIESKEGEPGDIRTRATERADEVRPGGTGTLGEVPTENVPSAGTEEEAEAGATGGTETSGDRGEQPDGQGLRDLGGRRGSDETLSQDTERRGAAEPGRREPGAERTGGETGPEDHVAGHLKQNYRISPEDRIGETTPGQKQKDLIAALKALKQIEREGRLATPEEQALLVRFPGWGWTGNLLHPANEKPTANRHKEYMQIAGLLTPEELAAARSAALNSHFTSPTVIRAMWQALEGMGFRGGRVLEPSAGIGLFMGLAPDEVASGTAWHAIEKDDLTGRILRQLYQNATVEVQGFEESRIPDGHFDVVISNVPFGNIPIHDAAFAKKHKAQGLRSRIHNYFFAKAIEKARPGGIVAFITSHGTMDARDPAGRQVREWLGERADLLGVIRLPNNAFVTNAGTEVTTDIIFLQKRREGEAGRAQAFTFVEKLTDADTGDEVIVNEYFARNKDMALGFHSMRGKMRVGGGAWVEAGRVPLAVLVIAGVIDWTRDGLRVAEGWMLVMAHVVISRWLAFQRMRSPVRTHAMGERISDLRTIEPKRGE